MVQRLNLDGYDACLSKLESFSKDQTVFVLFTGSKDSAGNSWCPDCVTGNPIP